MTVIINRKSYEVKDEKEARALANGRSYIIKEGVVYRVILNDCDLENIKSDSRKVHENK